METKKLMEEIQELQAQCDEGLIAREELFGAVCMVVERWFNEGTANLIVEELANSR